MGKNIFLTGQPGVGKTTIIKKWIEKIENAGGFYTEEIREKGKRKGFKIVTLDGKEGILASCEKEGRLKVGKYTVDIEEFENTGVKSIQEALENEKIKYIVIDEIGKMELFSERFKEVVEKALESDKIVIGVLTKAKNDFAEKIRKRKDVKIIEVDKKNRDKICESFETILKGGEDGLL